jgi:predicted HTH domain antitoxin
MHKAEMPDRDNGSDLPIPKDRFERLARQYVNEELTLGQAARKAGIPKLQLRQLFAKHDVPLRMGPSSMEELKQDIEAARRAADE